ncbi:MAG: ribosomal RNA small subunit methyltransferase A [Clostridia bacterium]|nr:ribosomal RNA small subunit methyltransferase A [Clostridia bacterium]
MNLCNLTTVRELLERYGLAPQKGFGQNFLINPDVPARIAGSSAMGRDCGWGGADSSAPDGVCALEIGPGIGAMTRELSAIFEKVLAVEIDRGLIPLLGETLEDCENVRVINEDFMKLSVKDLLSESFGDSPVRICANLPYYITSPIIMAILEAYAPSERPQVESVTVLVQNEVADRLCAEAGSNEYGSITASVNLCGTARKLFTVPAGCFYPAPKVTSAVVQITLYKGGVREAFPDLPEDDGELDKLIGLAKRLISAGFAQRRKTLTNALSSVCPKESIVQALEHLGIRTDIRGEKLSAADFVAIAKFLRRKE